MKKTFALVLGLLLLLPLFASCSPRESDDVGAIISMYIGGEIRNFDPAYTYNDTDALKVMGLLYESLFRLDSKGNVKKALAKSYKYTANPEEGEYKMEIRLKDTMWSDKTEITADDVIYAWRRILDPAFTSEAACLLYDIKNARAVKAGDISIDALGLSAPDTKLVEILFEKDIDPEAFTRILTSPVLVPLREDKVEKPKTDERGDIILDENGNKQLDTDWAEKSSSLVCSGPFVVKTLNENEGRTYTLESNKYYYASESDLEYNRYDKHVKAYRILVHYEYTLDQLLADYNEGNVFYIGRLPLSEIQNYMKELTTQDTFFTYSLAINTTSNPILEDARVRRALSLAIDRNELVSLTGGIDKPATGLVPSPVFNTKAKTSFRKEGGDLISTSANMDEAKNLLKEAGISRGTIQLSYRSYSVSGIDKLTAEYIKQQWEALGFTVQLQSQSRFFYLENMKTQNYEVILVDRLTPTTDAYSALAPFALDFSGTGRDVENNNFDVVPHVSGYNSETYNELIEAAYGYAPGTKERADKLHEAEALLMQDMPIIPLTFKVDYYMSQGLKKIENSYYGYRYFEKTSQNNYKDYLPAETQ